jgi:hypothetical protein
MQQFSSFKNDTVTLSHNAGDKISTQTAQYSTTGKPSTEPQQSIKCRKYL